MLFVFFFYLEVAQAPLKPKTPRGTKTPINRNQLTQSRGLGGIMVKRAYEAVSDRLAWATPRGRALVYDGAEGGPSLCCPPFSRWQGFPSLPMEGPWLQGFAQAPSQQRSVRN